MKTRIYRERRDMHACMHPSPCLSSLFLLWTESQTMITTPPAISPSEHLWSKKLHSYYLRGHVLVVVVASSSPTCWGSISICLTFSFHRCHSPSSTRGSKSSRVMSSLAFRWLPLLSLLPALMLVFDAVSPPPPLARLPLLSREGRGIGERTSTSRENATRFARDNEPPHPQRIDNTNHWKKKKETNKKETKSEDERR